MEEKDPKGLMEGKDVYKFGWICNKKTVCFVFYTHINTNRTEPLGFPRQIGDTERTYLRGCVIVRIKISNLSTSSCPWSLSSLIAKKKNLPKILWACRSTGSSQGDLSRCHFSPFEDMISETCTLYRMDLRVSVCHLPKKIIYLQPESHQNNLSRPVFGRFMHGRNLYLKNNLRSTWCMTYDGIRERL